MAVLRSYNILCSTTALHIAVLGFFVEVILSESWTGSQLITGSIALSNMLERLRSGRHRFEQSKLWLDSINKYINGWSKNVNSQNLTQFLGHSRNNMTWFFDIFGAFFLYTNNCSGKPTTRRKSKARFRLFLKAVFCPSSDVLPLDVSVRKNRWNWDEIPFRDCAQKKTWVSLTILNSISRLCEEKTSNLHPSLTSTVGLVVNVVNRVGEGVLNEGLGIWFWGLRMSTLVEFVEETSRNCIIFQPVGDRNFLQILCGRNLLKESGLVGICPLLSGFFQFIWIYNIDRILIARVLWKFQIFQMFVTVLCHCMSFPL